MGYSSDCSRTGRWFVPAHIALRFPRLVDRADITMSKRRVTASDIARCGGMSTATRRYWARLLLLRGEEPFSEYDAVETAVAQAIIAATQANVLRVVFPALRSDLRVAALEGSSELWAVIAEDGYDYALARSRAEAGEYASTLYGLAWTVSLQGCIQHARQRYSRTLASVGNANADVRTLKAHRSGTSD